MSELSVEGARDVVRPRWAWVRAAWALVAAIVLVSVVVHVVWLVRFRNGFVTEWDESGYMQFALSNYDALRDEGPWTFAKTVGGRGGYGPLLPLVTSLSYPVLGRGVFESLLVLPLFFAGLVTVTYGLARQFVSSSWAVVAALAVAAMPAVLDYTRLFHFALPAAACMTAALWALIRSEGLRRPGWAAAFGLFVALTLLARTMTVAYAPAFLLAAGTQFLVSGGELRLRIRNLGLAAGVSLLVAGPWYIRNARSVYDILMSAGYGDESARYGAGYPLFSWALWTKELRLDLVHLGVLLAAAMLLAFAVALAQLLLDRPARFSFHVPHSVRGAGLLALALAVIAGYVALTSSRNQGTAFALPWLPALVVLAVVAAASIRLRGLRVALAGAFVAVSVVTALSKSGWIEPLAEVRTVAVPGLDRGVVTDGRGIIQREVEAAGYEIEPYTEPLPAMHREWLSLARDVVGWSLRRADARGEPLGMILGTDDLIFSNWRLILAAQLWERRFQPVGYLQTFPDGDTVQSYRRQLLETPRHAFVSFDPAPYSTVTRRKAEAAARSLGFVRARSFTMPDGRELEVWWRESDATD